MNVVDRVCCAQVVKIKIKYFDLCADKGSHVTADDLTQLDC